MAPCVTHTAAQPASQSSASRQPQTGLTEYCLQITCHKIQVGRSHFSQLITTVQRRPPPATPGRRGTAVRPRHAFPPPPRPPRAASPRRAAPRAGRRPRFAVAEERAPPAARTCDRDAAGERSRVRPGMAAARGPRSPYAPCAAAARPRPRSDRPRRAAALVDGPFLRNAQALHTMVSRTNKSAPAPSPAHGGRRSRALPEVRVPPPAPPAASRDAAPTCAPPAAPLLAALRLRGRPAGVRPPARLGSMIAGSPHVRHVRFRSWTRATGVVSDHVPRALHATLRRLALFCAAAHRARTTLAVAPPAGTLAPHSIGDSPPLVAQHQPRGWRPPHLGAPNVKGSSASLFIHSLAWACYTAKPAQPAISPR